MSSDEVQLYFNPSCSKCIYALDFLKANGITPTIIEYLENVPSFSELKSIIEKLGLNPMDIIRTTEPLFIEKFSNKDYSSDELIEIIVQNPILLQRPILVKQNKAVIGRTDSALEKVI